jgi:transcriptional regulator with XRE-family HTH domain
MNISKNIYNLRKASGLTQEALAEKLNISFQAVSKWENGQSLPDIAMLPLLAEIFGTSIDRLFGREAGVDYTVPWEDDEKLRGIVFKGHKILKKCDDLSKLTFTVEGDALNVESNCSVNCGNVEGNVEAGVDVNCGNVEGDAEAGVNVNCGNVSGDVSAGVSVTCCDVGGTVNAGVSVNCRAS